MRLLAKLSTPLLAVSLLSGQVNPRVWRLIGPDARAITGVNLDRYRQTALSESRSTALNLPFGATGGQAISISGDPKTHRAPLEIIIGDKRPPQLENSQPFPMLDANTAILGDEDGMREAAGRWNGDAPLSDLAARVRKLAESYDAWILVVKPLDNLDDGLPVPASKYRSEVVRVVEEIAAGIRFGPFYEVRIDVLARTSEDAYSLAALGRWLPGLIQTTDPRGTQSRILDLAENLAVQVAGRTVTLSLGIPEHKLADLLRSLHKEDEGQ